MGFLSQLFGSRSVIHRQLEEYYVAVYHQTIGMSLREAKEAVRGMLTLAKQEAASQGTIGHNAGDALLQQEATNEEIRVSLAKKRSEGVTDADISWWWNLHDLERRMMLKVDENFRVAMFTKLLSDGLDSDEAARRVKQVHPIYGNPEDARQVAPEDEPLPYELKDRVNTYVERRSRTDPEQFKKELAEVSTVNALIRREIRNGRL